MWGDIKIGNGDSGNMARILTTVEQTNISHNEKSYWISNCILNLGITIMKNTAEGKKLTQMIAQKKKGAVIQDWLDDIVLKNATCKQLKEKILEYGKKEFQRGSIAKGEAIKSVLFGGL